MGGPCRVFDHLVLGLYDTGRCLRLFPWAIGRVPMGVTGEPDRLSRAVLHLSLGIVDPFGVGDPTEKSGCGGRLADEAEASCPTLGRMRPVTEWP